MITDYYHCRCRQVLSLHLFVAVTKATKALVTNLPSPVGQVTTLTVHELYLLLWSLNFEQFQIMNCFEGLPILLLLYVIKYILLTWFFMGSSLIPKIYIFIRNLHTNAGIFFFYLTRFWRQTYYTIIIIMVFMSIMLWRL